MYVIRLSCTCRKRIKGRKERKITKTKEKKQKLDKMKSEKRK
jgi:hypothetical protein